MYCFAATAGAYQHQKPLMTIFANQIQLFLFGIDWEFVYFNQLKWSSKKAGEPSPELTKHGAFPFARKDMACSVAAEHLRAPR